MHKTAVSLSCALNADRFTFKFPLQLTRNCVIKEEAKKPSYKHMGGQQYLYQLVHLCDT